jgi:hypothetical protein
MEIMITVMATTKMMKIIIITIMMTMTTMMMMMMMVILLVNLPILTWELNLPAQYSSRMRVGHTAQWNLRAVSAVEPSAPFATPEVHAGQGGHCSVRFLLLLLLLLLLPSV